MPYSDNAFGLTYELLAITKAGSNRGIGASVAILSEEDHFNTESNHELAYSRNNVLSI